MFCVRVEIVFESNAAGIVLILAVNHSWVILEEVAVMGGWGEGVLFFLIQREAAVFTLPLSPPHTAYSAYHLISS